MKSDFPSSLETPGARIRMMRRSKALTQQDLAKAVFVSQSAVAHWEADRFTPTPQIQRLLAEALGVSRLFLFGEQAA